MCKTTETITIYTQHKLNRHTGEVIRSNPVELTEEQFLDWVEPAIPHLVRILLDSMKDRKEVK
ncbi:hypothetical protein [Clostridium formicaceticum]|uniref:Uncharacterized protein n=1 Tax=Clostridium formicaceticum TaxID=1497 RepID=A0AAC9WFM9_9CLOT|nr:hypothetical protein [Clostridium formicaceticum]AOY76661.1 hypothetical protein BJL90_12770 [Clostridium formicaceticum]ARE87087.1 hypothetical protein CLFO_14730 [Clostridium formicaceticum]